MESPIPQDALALLKCAKTSPDQKEQAIYAILHKSDLPQANHLFAQIQTYWPQITTSRLTKIIKNTLKAMPDCVQTLDFIENLIEINKNKKLLQITLKTKKTEILFALNLHRNCLDSIANVQNDLKKHNDKQNQIKMHILESNCYYSLKNILKAKSAMTTARALSVSCFCSYSLLADLDFLNGKFLMDESKYKTGLQYLLESMDGYFLDKNYEKCLSVFKCLLLCGVMDASINCENLLRKISDKISMNRKNEKGNTLNCDNTENVDAGNIFNAFMKDETIQILLEIKEAVKSRNISKHSQILQNTNIMKKDEFITKHLQLLYNDLLQKNILKIIEPFSVVKLEYISENIGLNMDLVESSLRDMILDNKINGIIDHCNRNFIGKKENKKEDKNNEILIELTNELSK